MARKGTTLAIWQEEHVVKEDGLPIFDWITEYAVRDDGALIKRIHTRELGGGTRYDAGWKLARSYKSAREKWGVSTPAELVNVVGELLTARGYHKMGGRRI